MWMLWLFSTSADWNHTRDIVQLFQLLTSSEVLKRYAALAIAKGGSRSEALIVKDDFSAASDMLKLAILKASHKLGNDERRHW
jgi:hypothetical protein